MAFLATIKAHGSVILNVLRAVNVLGLLAAAISCAVIIFKTGSRDKAGWWFFDSVSWAFTFLSCLFLIGSEFPVIRHVRDYYEENWPLLSHEHGLSWLAMAMIMISVKILGSLYNPARFIDGPFRSIVLGGGCLVFATAIITIILSSLFHDNETGINARTLRSKRAAQAAGIEIDGGTSSDVSSVNEKQGVLATVSGLFGVKKPAASNNTAISKRQISPPRSISSSSSSSRSTSRSTDPGRRPSGSRVHVHNGSDDHHPSSPDHDRRSPINPEIRRPDTAMHPYFNKLPRYSEASMPRDFI